MDLAKIVYKVECGESIGTAFFISNNRAITAFHVIGSDYSVNPIYLKDTVGNTYEAQLSNKIDDYYKKLDIALLEVNLPVPIDNFPILVAYDSIEENTTCSSRGFPKSKQITADNLTCTVNQQLQQVKDNKIDIELEHSKKLDSYKGYSGAPLLIDNAIIGLINTELIERGLSKELSALSLKHIKKLITDEGIRVIERNIGNNNSLRQILTEDWFDNHISKSIKDLGPRYTPELNVEVKDITHHLDILTKNQLGIDYIFTEFNNYISQQIKSLNKLNSKPNITNNQIIALQEKYKLLERQFSAYNYKSIEEIPISDLVINVKSIIDYKNNITRDLRNNSNLNKEIKDLWEFLQNLGSITNDSKFIQSITRSLQLLNNPYLLLKGEAGIGKSHLLADIVMRQKKLGLPSIFLLGQQFLSEETPWTQIANNLLRLDYASEQDFLKVLNEIGEEKGHRILFIIDAINEGKGKNFWPDFIYSFIDEFKKFPWIGLVLSIRSSYYNVVFSENLLDKHQVTSIEHTGFGHQISNAIQHFFRYYQILLPKIPLLIAEFNNPLFLKLFCESINGQNLKAIPLSYDYSISNVIDYFIKNIDKKLSTKFGYNLSAKATLKVITKLVELGITKDNFYIPYDEACRIANHELALYTVKRGFIDELVSEGVLSKNINPSSTDEYIYFAYEKLGDYLIADVLLEQENIETAFRNEGSLYKYIENSSFHQGILEALSVQLPKKYKKELVELLDDECKTYSAVMDAFIYSLLWRNKDTVLDGTEDYINNYILCYESSFDLFLSTIYSVSGDPQHPYNISRLHNWLLALSLSERDQLWTTILKDKTSSDQDYHGINRLLNWILNFGIYKTIEDESIRLMSIAISWLFTTTNKELRDKATKALVILFKDRLKVAFEVSHMFKTVNDPYVYERILAAIYGAVLNSDKRKDLHILAAHLEFTIFKKEEVYPNVLVRDYARNIIEYALFKEEYTPDIELIRPPYSSKLPDKLPTDDDIKKYKLDYKNEPRESFYGQNVILFSMTTEYPGRGYGDFGRYTFQSTLTPWSKKDVPPDQWSNYACQLIFEKFGYDIKLHGEYDFSVQSQDRNKNTIERIGKKYQWLALYEIVAKLTDNYPLADGTNYQGPWHDFLRNIDPTYIDYKGSKSLLSHPKETRPLTYSDWDVKDSEWLISEDNLPDPLNIINYNDEFICLQSYITWNEDNDTKEDLDKKSLWYQVRSYLVKDTQYDELKSWLEGQELMGRWMPEGGEFINIFSEELYWSPVYKCMFNSDDYEDWRTIDSSDINIKILPTVEERNWEGSNAISYFILVNQINKGMNLKSSDTTSFYYNHEKTLACFDPSVVDNQNSKLNINKKLFLQYLSTHNLKVIWTVLGEKQIIGYGPANSSNKWLELSGIYYIDEITNEITGNIKTFIKG